MKNSLVYKPYIMLTKFLSDNDFIRVGKYDSRELFQTTHQEVVDSVDLYREGLDTNLENYANSCPAESAPGDFESYLYKPATFLTFGHTDYLSLTLVDDFSSIFNITSKQLNFSLEQFSLSLLPDLSESGFTNERLASANVIDVEKLFLPMETKPGEEINPLKSAPLILYSQFKIDGLTILGQGLNAMRAVFEAVITKISDAGNSLIEESEQHPFSCIDPDLREDKESTWCAFLDTQGAFDFALVIGCNNFSVGGAILEKLQSMTIGDLAEEPANARFMERMESELTLLPEIAKRSGIKSFLGTHVFSSIYSSASCTFDVIKDPEKRKVVHGVISANAAAHIKPGHLADVNNNIDDNTVARPIPLTESENSLKRDQLHLMHMGRNDVVTNFDSRFKDDKVPDLFPTQDLLKYTWNALNEFGSIAVLAGETGLNYCSANIAIPVPRKKSSKEEVTWATHCNDEQFRFDAKQLFRGRSSSIQLKRLEEALAILGVTNTVKLRVVRAFSQYLVRLTDPVLYDSVCDLYDSYLTLYRVLDEAADESDFLANAQIEHIVEYVLALDNALNHRSSIGSPENEVRDVDINFFGALNQIAASSDAALRCFCGILKWYARLNRGSCPIVRKDRDDHCYDRISAIKSFKLTSADGEIAKLNIVNHRKQLKSHCLAKVSVGVGNMFEPSAIFTDLHEAIHLFQFAILDELDEHVEPEAKVHYRATETEGLEVDGSIAAMRKEARNENFANSLSALLMFDVDPKLFAINQLVEFSQSPKFRTSPIMPSNSQTKVRVKTAEFLIQTFVVHQMLNKRFSGQSIDVGSVASIVDFESFISDYGVYCQNARETGLLDDAREYLCLDVFGPFSQDYPRVETLIHGFQLAVAHYEAYAKKDQWNFNGNRDDLRSTRRYIQSAILKSFRRGDAFVQSRIVEAIQATGHVESDKDGPDDIMIICDLYSAYTRLMYGRPDAWEIYQDGDDVPTPVFDPAFAIHLDRHRDGGVNYQLGDDEQWNLFQIGCGFVGHFCPDPKWRAEVMKWKCVIIKKLWDLSRDLGFRRMREILDLREVPAVRETVDSAS